MQDAYTTAGAVQSVISDFYFRHGNKLDFIEAVQEIYQQGTYLKAKPTLPLFNYWSTLTDGEFVTLLDRLPIDIKPMLGKKSRERIQEVDILPDGSDVFVYKHFCYINDIVHSHDYFEVCYVFKGSCRLQFEKETHSFKTGELCIIAPMSVHEIIVDDESSVLINVSIRKSTFDSAFFNLISRKDLLSIFFRTLLYEQPSANYLSFITDNSEDIRFIIKNLFMEGYRDDLYANNCCISWVNILFSNILRNYSQSIRFYNYKVAPDFSLVLKYIQQNYRRLKLKDLACSFHYNESHLSTLIKKNTGLSFTELITNFKISESVDYLLNTDMSIEKIAEIVGYNSSDHFSRTFKQHYRCSPQQYRKAAAKHP